MRSFFLSRCLGAAIALTPPAWAAEPMPFSAAGDFSETAVLRGVLTTQQECESVSPAVWVTSRDHGQACIRFWTARFPVAGNGRAVVFFHGDIFVGVGKTAPRYLNSTPQKVQRDVELTARKLDAPYVFVGRPGTFGSSGNHMHRRRPAESDLISAALDQIKQRLGIREFVIAGQSGGGHVTASLLALRSDIVCAVPTSSPSSPRARWTQKGLKKDTTGFADSFEPAEHLQKSRLHPQLRVFVLGDPDDRNVPWPAQSALSDRLAALGVPTAVLRGQGAGPDAHGLPNAAHEVASWCFHDRSIDEILRRAAQGLRG